MSPNLRGRTPSPDPAKIVNDNKVQSALSPRRQPPVTPKTIPQTCITMDDDTLTVKTENSGDCEKNKLTSPPHQGASLTAPSPQRSPMRIPPIIEKTPPRPSSPGPYDTSVKPQESFKKDDPKPKSTSGEGKPFHPSNVPTIKAIPPDSPTKGPVKSPQPPPSPLKCKKSAPPPPGTDQSTSQPKPEARSSNVTPNESQPPTRVSSPRTLSPVRGVLDQTNSNNTNLKSSSSTEPLIGMDSPETPRSTKMETPSPTIEQVKTIKRQPKNGWL